MREGWKTQKLGELGKVITGSTPSTRDESNYSSPDVCFVKPSDIAKTGITTISNTEFHISRKAFQQSRKLTKGSVLTTCIGIIGKVGILGVDATCNQQINAIIPDNGIVSSSFLAYSILSRQHLLSSIANAPVVPIINKGEFSSVLIPVPPITEQEKIVAELDCLTSIIDKKKQQLEEMDKLAQSIFYDMFGDPIANEKGWAVKCVGEICSLKSGNSNANNSSPGDLPYVKVGDMGIPGNERRITTSSQFVSRDDNKKSIFPIGTTIFPKRGGAIYTNKKRLTSIEICCDLNTMGVIPKKDVLHPLYLFQFFLGLDLGTLCNGAAIPQLNNSDIAPLKIEVPPIALQNEFAQKVEAIEKQKELVKRSIVETEMLFNSRMDFWFNN